MSPLGWAAVAIAAGEALFVALSLTSAALAGDRRLADGARHVALAAVGLVWVPPVIAWATWVGCVAGPLRLIGGWGGIDQTMRDYERPARSIRTRRRSRWLWVYVYTLRADRADEDGTKAEHAIDSLIVTIGSQHLGFWIGRRSNAYATGRPAGASRRTLKPAPLKQETP